MTVLALLRRFWWAPVILGLVIALLIQRTDIARKDAKLQHAADVMALTAERIAHAQAAALAKDLAHARTVETAQQKVTDNASTSYQADVAALRARYDKLRAEVAHGVGGASGVPALPYAALGPDGAAGQDGLPTPDALIASVQAVRLERLQGWIRDQAAIDRTEGSVE